MFPLAFIVVASISSDSVFSTFSFGWSSELISQKNHLIDTLITNQSAELNYSKINQKSILKVYGDFFLFGYKKNNYAINLFFKRQILNNKAFNFSAKIKKSKFAPLNQIHGLCQLFKISKGNIIFLLDSDDFFLGYQLSMFEL